MIDFKYGEAYNQFDIESINCKVEELTYKEQVELRRKLLRDGVIAYQSHLHKEEDIYKEFKLISSVLGIDPITDAARRKKYKLTNEASDEIASVDLNCPAIEPHAETSFSPIRPSIIGFVCLEISDAASMSGLTTLVDGNNYWDGLNPNSKILLQSATIKYHLNIDVDIKKSSTGGKRPWYLDYEGITDTELDTSEAKISFKYQSPFINMHPITRKVAIANHVFLPLKTEPQINKIELFRENKLFNIEENLFWELGEALNKNIRTYQWEKGASLFIDNNRFMHGRLGYDMREQRRIYICQLKSYYF